MLSPDNIDIYSRHNKTYETYAIILFLFLSAPSVAPEMNNTAMLQCVFLPYIEQGHCYTKWYKTVGLTWVDEAGTAIQEDAQHHIKHQSSCKVTLTVSLQAADSKTFRCQAAVDEKTQTSPKFAVGASGAFPTL